MATLSASEVSARLRKATTPEEVDDAVMAMVAEGELSDFMLNPATWPVLTLTDGGNVLRMRVSPTYASLGKDAYPIGRGTPFLAQAIASRLGVLLPSRKIVLAAQKAGHSIPYVDVKTAPFNIPGNKIATQDALDAAAKGIRDGFAARGLEPGQGIEYGSRKSIVAGPNLDGSQVAIVGGVYADGRPVQPYSTVHSAKGYADDSHGIGPLVFPDVELNGRSVDLNEDVMMAQDPVIAALANDNHSTSTGKLQRFRLQFPNANKDSATFAVMTGEDESETYAAFASAGGAGGASGGAGGGGTAEIRDVGTPGSFPAPPQSPVLRGFLGAVAGGIATAAFGLAGPWIAGGAIVGGGIGAISTMIGK